MRTPGTVGRWRIADWPELARQCAASQRKYADERGRRQQLHATAAINRKQSPTPPIPSYHASSSYRSGTRRTIPRRRLLTRCYSSGSVIARASMVLASDPASSAMAYRSAGLVERSWSSRSFSIPCLSRWRNSPGSELSLPA
jgi:hypothetical protein